MTSVAKPILPKDLPVGRAESLRDDLELEDARFEDFDWSTGSSEHLGLSGVVMVKGDLTSTKFFKTVWRDVRLEKCQLAGSVLDEAGLSRVELLDAQGTGMIITNAKLRDVTFKNCRLTLANFRYSHLLRVTFEDCMLAEADFAYAQLEHVSFVRCDLTSAQFSNVKLAHVDLRSSDMSGLNGVSALRGATIGPDQLVSISAVLAAELGITVAD